MPLDLYSTCICGSGKKLKFCCIDMIAELEAELGMIDADQNQACINHNKGAETRHPGRAALAVLRLMALLRSGDINNAREESAKFLAAHPQNPVALVYAAMIKGVDGKGVEAISDLQSALEVPEAALPYETVEAAVRIAEVLLGDGHPMAARGHATVAAALARDSQEVHMLLNSIIRSGQLALPQRDDYIWFKPKDETAPWKADYEAALKFAKGGQWRKASPMLTAIGEKHPQAREVWQALAYCQAFLAQEAEAAKAWRKISTNKDVSLGDAVDAEAQAQLLDRAADAVEMVDYRYTVKDLDRLIEKIASDKRAVSFPVDPEPWTAAGEPPPQVSYDWLDRQRPEQGAIVTAETAPVVLVSLSLFGKRTDREASLSIHGTRTPGDDAARKAVLELAGDLITGEPTEEVMGLVAREIEAVSPQPWFPPVGPEEARQVIKGVRARAIREAWPELPLAKFGGKTARQAAAEQPVAVLAALTILELRDEDDPSGVNFDEFKKSLGLPAIPPSATADITLPLTQLLRVDVKQLSDQDLLAAFQRAGSAMARGFLAKVIRELLTREQFKGEAASLYRQLISITSDSTEVLRLLEEVRQVPNQKEVEMAMWDLHELGIRMGRAELDAFQRLGSQITTKYNHIPEVRRAFAQLLMQYGLIDENGQPTRRMAAGGAPAAAAAPSAAAAAPGGVWTPDAAAPPPAAGKKSGLWVPGMD